MKMLLIPVPECPDARLLIEQIGVAAGNGNLHVHEVELDAAFDIADLDDPKYGLAKAAANLRLLPIALNAFTDALNKERAAR